MSSITVSAARQTLPAQLDRVAAGEEVEITRHGRVVAVLISPSRLRHRRAHETIAAADRLGARLEQAREEPLRAGALTPERAEELVASVREGRSRG
ncbi:MAG: type II toxin-antitoxin system prevent-host-death family antitoxin [Actinomycetia bacterium]|nr:type II toxin-antitoxin system prevent-host-death family antitoxin [Actinomycetes bacterium]